MMRDRQGSNLRGQSPLDFKSSPVTTWVRSHQQERTCCCSSASSSQSRKQQKRIPNSLQHKVRARPGSNQGPFGLRPNALPLSYVPVDQFPRALLRRSIDCICATALCLSTEACGRGGGAGGGYSVYLVASVMPALQSLTTSKIAPGGVRTRDPGLIGPMP